MGDHIYIGSAKERETQYGTDLDLQLEIDDLGRYVSEYGYVNKAGKHVVRVKISRRREVGRFGETHSVEINTWKPDGARQGQGHGQRSARASTYQKRPANARTAPQQGADDVPPDFPDDIPF